MGRGKKSNYISDSITDDVMHSIDRINAENDYNPYKAVKKTNLKAEELFTNDLYYNHLSEDALKNDEEQEIERKKMCITYIVVGLVAVGLIGLIGFLAMQILNMSNI